MTCALGTGALRGGAPEAFAVRPMAADALAGYLKLLREDRRPIPESDAPLATPILEEVTVTLARA